MFDAIKAIAGSSLDNTDSSLFYEILAETCRNPLVAERFEAQTAVYREGMRRLAALARHAVSSAELPAYRDILIACSIGLGHRTAVSPPLYSEDTARTNAV